MKFATLLLCASYLLLLNSDNKYIPMGLLQFKVKHNLQDNRCLLDNSCTFKLEEEERTEEFLHRLRRNSSMAVLHWDRAIPWLAFSENPPAGVSRQDFYDRRIDEELKGWIDQYELHFHKMDVGYLAVSILNGDRNRLQPFRLAAAGHSKHIDVTDECPVLEPETVVEFSYLSGEEIKNDSFHLATSYTNFILYLNDKLQPDYLALMVEANLFKEQEQPCPSRWQGFVRLYHHIYDTIRPEVKKQVKLFATLSLKPLLEYDSVSCYGDFKVQSCDEPLVPQTYEPADPLKCYPLNLDSVHDFDRGNRLEILALSFYPDAMLMGKAENNLIKVYPENWDGKSHCAIQAQSMPFLDPFGAIDRFGWNKPIAIAELGARSGRVYEYIDGFIYEFPGDEGNQRFWLEHFLRGAKKRNFEFYIQSFIDDYSPIGIWAVQQNYLDKKTFSLLNNFSYMGLHTEQENPKPEVMQTWLRSFKKLRSD